MEASKIIKEIGLKGYSKLNRLVEKIIKFFQGKKLIQISSDANTISDQSRLNILLGILAISTTFTGVLIALMIKMSKIQGFANNYEVYFLIIKGVVYILAVSLILYWLVVMLSLMFELLDISAPKENKLFQHFNEPLFSYVCGGLTGILWITLIFTLIMIIIILALINKFLAIGLVIVIVIYNIFLARQKKKQKTNKKKFSKFERILSIIVLVGIVYLICFSIHLFTTGIEIEMDKNAYYSGDIINIMIQPSGLWQTHINNVSYNGKTLLGAGCSKSTLAIPTYCSINSSIFNQTSHPYLVIEYKFLVGFSSKGLSQKIYLPYYNVYENDS